MGLFTLSWGILFASNLPNNIQVAQLKQNQFQADKSSAYHDSQIIYKIASGDSVVWNEDWETGGTTWTALDETDVGAQWHLDDWNAFGGSGLSWWMADTTLGLNGGYLDEWYQVMDTDPIDLSSASNPVLTFQHRYNVETPGGEPTGYDGWDGQNVRISTDGGSTWMVLASPSPAYTNTSLYSFGFSHNEGLGIPGWCGQLLNWTQVTVDLTDYAGQSVQIRFAFASDPGFSTPDQPDMFAWQVDDIQVDDGGNILYFNDGSPDGMSAANNTPVGGNLWHIETGVGLPSGTQFADCNDPMTGSYNPNMINSFISDYFWLPDTLNEIYLDFYLQGTYDDNDVFPMVDYFGAYVQVKGEQAWRYVSNITQDPNGSNFVYSSAPATWLLFSQTYSVGLVDLAPLKDDTVRVKFTMESDEDTPIGTALQVDDVVVWSPDLIPFVGAAPTGLSANAGDNVVDLMWDDLNLSGHKYFAYDDGSYEDGIHLTSGTGDAGVYFNSAAESTIDTIWVWGYQANTTTSTTLKVWEVSGSGIINATPSYTKAVTLTQSQWNAFDLTSDNWTVSGDFVAGIEISVDIFIPLDESTVPSMHSWVNLGGWQTWQAVAQTNQLPDGEWGVRSAVTYTNPTNITYNVYRRESETPNYGNPLITGLTDPSHSDNTVANGTEYCYVVTANYPGLGESTQSGEVCAMPEASTVYLLNYDDGSPESFYQVGSANYMAVKFTPTSYPSNVYKILYYLQSGPGSIQLKVWDDDGANGLPGTELGSFSISNVVQGWNEYTVTSTITISDGDVYVGYRATPTSPDLGMDETPPIVDRSYLDAGSGWQTITSLGLNANAMIRVMLDALPTGIEDNELVISEYELFQNYPNPFNPETNISFTIPADLSGERATLKIFDVLGREVLTLFDDNVTSGVYNLLWNGRDNMDNPAASGIYIYRLTTGNKIQTKKMVLMK
jgi:hypothetical protein